MKAALLIALTCLLSAPMFAQKTTTDPETQPSELGLVHWYRNVETGIELAKDSGKPIFLQFQEVPGWATCTGYATQVLRNDVLVAAIENLFVPVVIYTSRGTAHDTEMLKEFNEPAWNNPVVRIIDTEKKDIVPRINGVYKSGGIAKNVLAAIDKAGIVLGDDARATLKKVSDGKEVSEAEAQAFRDAISNKITRELAKSLKSSVGAYESAEFGKAFEQAVKVRDDEDSDEAEKADAAYLIKLIEGRWAGLKAKAERLKTEREYLQLFEAVDESEKQFKGLAGAEAFFDEYSELKKDKQVKVEVKALEKLAKLEEKLGEAESDRERESLTKQLESFIEKNPGTRAAEKAAELLKD